MNSDPYETETTMFNTVLLLCSGAVLKTVQDFVRESELMADLRHPNIVCLIGVCMQEEPKVSSRSSKIVAMSATLLPVGPSFVTELKTCRKNLKF